MLPTRKTPVLFSAGVSSLGVIHLTESILVAGYRVIYGLCHFFFQNTRIAPGVFSLRIVRLFHDSLTQ